MGSKVTYITVHAIDGLRSLLPVRRDSTLRADSRSFQMPSSHQRQVIRRPAFTRARCRVLLCDQGLDWNDECGAVRVDSVGGCEAAAPFLPFL